MRCYTLKEFNNNKGLLDSSVDATYIIHLIGNGRLDHVYSQMKDYIITKTTYILFNKGYKKCKKNKNIDGTAKDLIDAFLYIFKDAKIKNYNNILILEDDFTFLPLIKDNNVIDDINNFIIKKQNDEFIYYLGCIPYIIIPSMTNHNIVILSSGTHSCIYSNKIINKVLNMKEELTDWDYMCNFKCYGKRYMYNKLLCYQLFPRTENSKSWGGNSFFMSNICKIGFKIAQLLQLDKRHDIGYPLFYNLSKVLFILIVIIIIYLTNCIIKIVKIKKIGKIIGKTIIF